jgi:hypothetical protein
MGHETVARMLLTFLCAVQGVATFLIDLNRTHATNPAWPRHARFHLVWQTLSVTLMSVFEVALVCWPGEYLQARFYLAVILVSIPLIAFLLAFVSRKLYGGALSDTNGIPPATVVFFGRALRADLNFVAVAAAFLALAAIVEIYTH